jgi:hypothetical protein
MLALKRLRSACISPSTRFSMPDTSFRVFSCLPFSRNCFRGFLCRWDLAGDRRSRASVDVARLCTRVQRDHGEAVHCSLRAHGIKILLQTDRHWGRPIGLELPQDVFEVFYASLHLCREPHKRRLIVSDLETALPSSLAVHRRLT